MRLARKAAFSFVLLCGAVAFGGCTTVLGDFTVSDQGASGDGGLDAIANADGTTQQDGQTTTDSSTNDSASEAGGCGAGQQSCNGTCVAKTDPHHCGSCANDCTALPNVDPNGVSCDTNGACVLKCNPGFGNCSGSTSTGCETDTSTAKHCGSCTTTCPASQPVCQKDVSGAYACATGCSGATPDLCGSTCTNKQTDPQNCNGCGNVCASVPNGTSTCNGGTCGYTCNSTYHTCTGQQGCFSDTDTAHCGASCTPCAVPQNGTATCTGGACAFSCNATFSPCGNTCVALGTDPQNCGQCGKICTAPANATPNCVNSACGFGCNSGFSLCNGACVDAMSDPNNCGTCGKVCGASFACVSGNCVCTGQTPNLCGGTCTNFQTDANNCGACGHSCLGGSCAAGQCQPITLLSNAGGNARGIAANGGVAYFGFGANGSSHIGSCNGNCSGGPTTLFTGNNLQTVAILPPNNLLYFTDENANTVTGFSLTTNSVVFSVASQANAEGLAYDATNLYWGASGSVGRANKTSGTAVTTFATGFNFAVALAFDPASGNLFIADYASAGRVAMCPTGAVCGSAWTAVTGNVPFATGVAVGGGHVFWTFLGNPANNYNDGGLGMCTTTGCSAPVAAAVGSSYGFASAITADPTYVYFHGGGNIWRCPLSGCAGTPTLLAANVGTARALANDATALYWTVDGEWVMKLAK